ncbi:toxin [Kitasatospora xanthocidica]|uniref:DUF397 domain-containing protein n=1 Tax=Kitasatospora xanthocidica TaxID=83382 RepID=UPI00167AD55B|nr:DUF397 domain-containing protein [Kitasatospora xanthocidica]GHF92503.1 toxin [Kitasatospora xanthocidica]
MLASDFGNVLWRKSSYSGQGGDCIEAAELPPVVAGGEWQKSSYSAQANECVEVRQSVLSGIAVRDSKDPDGSALLFPADAWASFLAGVKGGDFPAG